MCRGKNKHSNVTTYSQNKLYVLLAVKASCVIDNSDTMSAAHWSLFQQRTHFRDEFDLRSPTCTGHTSPLQTFLNENCMHLNSCVAAGVQRRAKARGINDIEFLACPPGFVASPLYDKSIGGALCVPVCACTQLQCGQCCASCPCRCHRLHVTHKPACVACAGSERPVTATLVRC